jgi:hypothetical protein
MLLVADGESATEIAGVVFVVTVAGPPQLHRNKETNNIFAIVFIVGWPPPTWNS